MSDFDEIFAQVVKMGAAPVPPATKTFDDFVKDAESEIKVARDKANTINFPRVLIALIPGVMGTRLDLEAPSGILFCPNWDPDDKIEMLRWVELSPVEKWNIFRNAKASVIEKPRDVGHPEVVDQFYGPFLKALQAKADAGGFGPGVFTVTALGYDWRKSNTLNGAFVAALAKKLMSDLELNRVILITHSMGGLVGRAACLGDSAFSKKVMAVIHTVQPATGASMSYENFLTGSVGGGDIAGKVLDMIVGNEWWKWLANMSGMPGPLQLLPNSRYHVPFQPFWLLHKHNGIEKDHSKRDIYDLYQESGFPGICFPITAEIQIVSTFTIADWDQILLDLRANLKVAQSFHANLKSFTHPNTSVVVCKSSSSTHSAASGATSDTPPFFKLTMTTGVGDGTVPINSAADLDSSEQSLAVGNAENALPPRLLMTTNGDHKSVLSQADTQEFIFRNIKYFVQLSTMFGS